MSDHSHYRLHGGDIEMSGAATDGECIAYLLHKDGRDILCVMEGDAYHQFVIGRRGVSRLVAEGGARLFSIEQAAP